MKKVCWFCCFRVSTFELLSSFAIRHSSFLRVRQGPAPALASEASASLRLRLLFWRGQLDPDATLRRRTTPEMDNRVECRLARRRRFQKCGRGQLPQDARGLAPKTCRAPGVWLRSYCREHAPTLDERTNQPRPDRALVIGAVALAHASSVMRCVARFARCERTRA